MQSISDLKQLLRGFGTYIYTGDKIGDLELMEEEVRELYRWKMIEITKYQQALLVIKRELRKISENR